MSNSLSETISTLNKLIETCKDGQEGFRLAAEAVMDDEDLKSFLFSCSLQRSKFAGELQNEVIALGEPGPEDTSSVSSALHRGWINLKSVITNRDNHAILAECERGEDSAVADYRKAVNSGLSRSAAGNRGAAIARSHRHAQLGAGPARPTRQRETAGRSAGEVVSDFKSSLQEKGRSFGASASDSWGSAQSKGEDVLHNTEIYVRENPFPAILTALGVGFALGLLVRLLESPQPRHIEVPIPKSVQKARDFDYQAAVLPFLWPVVKFFSSNYAASRKGINKAYKQASGHRREQVRRSRRQACEENVLSARRFHNLLHQAPAFVLIANAGAFCS